MLNWQDITYIFPGEFHKAYLHTYSWWECYTTFVNYLGFPRTL